MKKTRGLKSGLIAATIVWTLLLAAGSAGATDTDKEAASATAAGKPAPGRETALALKFTIPQHDLFPENIAHDPVSGDYFLGSMSHSRILRIHADGSYEDFVSGPESGLLSTIGMKVDARRRVLWACTGRFTLFADYDTAPARTGVVKFDIDDRTVKGRWMIDQESDYHIVNDLVLSSNGDAYLTTTLLGRVYRWPADTDAPILLLQLEPERHNNGIAIDDDEKNLFMAVDRSIYRLELGTRRLFELAVPDNGGFGTDGLYVYGSSLVAVKPRFGQIVQMFLNAEGTAADRVVVLAEGEEDFAYPTTGVVVGNELVFVATSYADSSRNLASSEQHPDVLIYEVALQSGRK